MIRRRLWASALVLVATALLLAACGGAAAPTPAEAPAAALPAEAPPRLAPALIFAVVHDRYTELYRDDGVRVASVDTAGPAAVQFAGDKAMVVDAQQARIFGPSGSQIGQGLPAAPNSSVAFGQERAVISQGAFAAVYDGSGQPVTNITTPAPARAGLLDDLIVLAAANWLGAYRLDGSQVLNVATAGEASLQPLAGNLVLADSQAVRFFTADGSPLGSPVDLSGQAGVSVVGERAVVIHPGWAEIFAADGSLAARVATAGLATATAVGRHICLRDDGGIRLLDAAGSQVVATLPQPGDAEVFFGDDRLVVVHDSWVGVYTPTGEALANIATSGRGNVALGDGRLIVADDEVIQVLSPDGQPVAAVIRLPGAEIRLADGRLVASADGQVALFNLDGAPLGAVATSGVAQVTPLPSGLLLVDSARAQLLSAQQGVVTAVAPVDGSTVVVVQP